MRSIKVSVLTPIYNHKAEFLEMCLESLHSQTLQEVEFLLIDNGATQESKGLIAQYVEKDFRFKVIRFETNQGYGKAMNAGLKAASGEYVAFLESDDWVESNIYEKLYELATNNDVDVVVSQMFYYYGQTGENKYFNKFPAKFLNKKITDDIISVRQYVEGVAAHWTKLYRNDFLRENNIDYNEAPISCPDVGFIYKTFVHAKSMFITPFAYLHYRRDNDNSSINSGDVMAQRIFAEQEYITRYLEKVDAERGIWDIKIHQEIQTFLYNYFNRCQKTKLQFLKDVARIFNEHIEKNRVTYKFFNVKELKCFAQIARNPVAFYFKSLVNNETHNEKELVRSYLFGLHKKKFTSTHKKYYLMGVQIDSRRVNAGKKQSKFFSKEATSTHNIYTILGIKFKIRNNLQYLNEQKHFYYLQKTNIQAASVHPKTFGEFKNKHKGQKIVVVGCGPSLKSYKPIEGALHIGVNRAFMNNNYKLDYLFIQDFLQGENDMELANCYFPDTCTKFYGILPELRYSQVRNVITRISNQVISDANARTYIIEDGVCRNWANNLEFEPIGDWKGCIFSALQFALYTNPAEIYLVGCDCSAEGHFHSEKNGVGHDLRIQKASWHSFAQYVRKMCPQTKIISVNPVGLKGLFEDLYQGE